LEDIFLSPIFTFLILPTGKMRDRKNEPEPRNLPPNFPPVFL
jgi:hypothetical protein